ncbi:MAG: ABC transporter permease [Caldilineaceae bacterium]|nr:ABC transporter permease [Caldilineaceae bacterium]
MAEQRRELSAIGPTSVSLQLAATSQVETPWQRTWRRFRRHKLAIVGLIFIAIIIFMGIFAPVVAPLDPLKTSLIDSLVPPNATYWLGTDPVGRDIWSRTVYAIRVSLSVGIVAVGISLIIALVLGTISGYYGGSIDMIVMRMTDIIMTIPSLVIIMAVVSILGPSIYNVMAVIGVLGWTGMARLLRAQILSVRERDFIRAAQSIGVTDWRIMLLHILPNSLAPVLVAATFGVAGAILTEAALSFLGFGVLPPTPSWGNMLNAARSLSRLQENPWFWMPPGVMILLTVLAINFIGDGLRDALDPRTK